MKTRCLHSFTPAIATAIFLLFGSRSSVFGFDSKGIENIVWRNNLTGTNWVWEMPDWRWYNGASNPRPFNNTNTVGILSLYDPNWLMLGSADFDRDGQPDLLWMYTVDRSIWMWKMNGFGYVSSSTRIAFLPNGYYFVGIGDFDFDGYPDLVWRYNSADYTAIWFLTGMSYKGSAFLSPQPGPNWYAGAVGDFDCDGSPDIFWYDSADHASGIWFMNGTNVTSTPTNNFAYPPTATWKPAVSGHFNGIGASDVIWRNFTSSGTNAGYNIIWSMRRTNVVASSYLPSMTYPDWSLGGTADYTNGMAITATTVVSPPTVTLKWRFGDTRPTTVQHRMLGAGSWTPDASNYYPFGITNTSLTVGERYEFLIGGTNFLFTGINARPNPMESPDRGKVILVVATNVTNYLSADLETLHTNLVGDGWTVLRTNVPPHNDTNWSANPPVIAAIKQTLKDIYNADQTHVKAAILIGHVPIPYSGCFNPDGHGIRSLPSDGYYADFSGTYTDTNTSCSNCDPNEPRHNNIAGDGKWDQNHFPGSLALAVGRIDFAKMPAFRTNVNESDLSVQQRLLKRYLSKDDQYRRKAYAFPPSNRFFTGQYFDSGDNASYYHPFNGEALKIGSRLVGTAPDALLDGDCFEPANSCLYGFIAGAGETNHITGGGTNFVVHYSEDMTNTVTEPHVSFVNMFGSLFHDFDYTNDLMRAFIATPTYGLAATWFEELDDRGLLSMERLALGETFGSEVQRTINNIPLITVDMQWTTIGDPTLRLQMLAPATNLSGTRTQSTNVVLSWTGSSEASQYFIYRSTSGLDGSWSKINSVAYAGTSYTNSAPANTIFQVRATIQTNTASGSFINLSQGVFFNVP